MRKLFHLAVLVVLIAGSVPAQDVAPLVRPRPKESITATVRKKGAKPTPTPQGAEAGRATDRRAPGEAVVAVVNQHYLTRAQLDSRLEFQRRSTEKKLAAGGPVESRTSRTPAKGDSTLTPQDDSAAARYARRNQMEERLFEAAQADALANAKRSQESDEVRDWVEQKMLADEARRHGLVISDEEFRKRLADVDMQAGLPRQQMDLLLSRMALTRADYEADVYEALLVEKLIDKYTAANYTPDILKKAWSMNPSFYRTPEMVRLAHFTVPLSGDENRADLKEAREFADRVRKALLEGKPWEKVFNEMKDPERGAFGADAGYFSLERQYLPEEVRVGVTKLKPGDVSSVITQFEEGDDGKAIPISYHVVKLLDRRPPAGDTFESALPNMKKWVQEAGRQELVVLLRDAGTHVLATNLGGIPADKIPKTPAKPARPVALLRANVDMEKVLEENSSSD